MDELKNFKDDGYPAKGSMKATVRFSDPDAPERFFDAKVCMLSLTESYIAAFGGADETDNPDEFMMVALPTDFSLPTIPVKPVADNQAWVYVHCGRTGYAQSGEVTEAVWNKDARTFSGRWICAGQADIYGRFEILDGEFNINY